MNRDDIIRMAREAGLEILLVDGQEEVGCGDGYYCQTEMLECFAALVAAAEREECAKVCDELERSPYIDPDEFAFAIRARGQA